VADLHVVEDLGDRQRGDRERPRGRQVEQRPAGGLEAILRLHDVADVRRVLLAEVVEDAASNGVELLAERLELFRGELHAGSYRWLRCERSEPRNLTGRRRSRRRGR
jgi:hypothetical protein